MFFLSERTRLAVTAAAILPSALATASSVRLGARCVVLITSSRSTNVCCFHRVQQGKETKEFQDLVKQMLSDMKIFKQLLRKSLNLIQGMEMMNQVYFQDINIPLFQFNPTVCCVICINSPRVTCKQLGVLGAVVALVKQIISHKNHWPFFSGENGSEENCPESSSLSSALCKRSSFIALRRAIYSSTIQVDILHMNMSQYSWTRVLF